MRNGNSEEEISAQLIALPTKLDPGDINAEFYEWSNC